MVKKIALEEHCLTPGFEDYWGPTVVDLPPKRREELYARLTDFGDMRLATMDKGGIARAVLAIAGPGVQAEKDTQMACRKARESNDFLAREIAKQPDRYSGFAHLPMQDAKAAADELERCMRELGLSGAMINGSRAEGGLPNRPAPSAAWRSRVAPKALPGCLGKRKAPD